MTAESSPGALDIGRGGRLLATCLLLPAAAFLWPFPAPFGGAPLVDVPVAESTAAGLVALACAPATLVFALRGVVARPIALGALLAAWLVAALGAAGAADTLARDRALSTWTSAACLVAAGATLGAGGRRVLLAAFPAAGVALVASAGVRPEWTGVLGNTGDLSEAALIGGVLGLGLFLYARGPARFVGFAAALSHALYAGLVPVHAGILAWLAAALAALAASPRRPEAARLARLALLATLVAVAARGARLAIGPERAPDAAGAAAEAAEGRAELGGVAFRLDTWRALPALVASSPWLGVGPGQFQAAFPPFRDPGELARSSRARSEPTPQEVEHAHSDWLGPFAELGWIGGGSFALFLVLVLARAAAALRGADPVRAAFGLAAIAVLANSAVNAPLLDGVMAPALAWPLFGALLAPAAPSRARGGARWMPVLLAALLAVQLPTALSLVEHGRALAELPSARVVRDGAEGLDAARLERILGDALAHRPDSVEALRKRGELLRARGADVEERRALLERELALREHSFTALLSLGNLEAERGDVAAAEAAYDRAAKVDASHPMLLANRLTLALDARDVAAVERALAALASEGRLDGADLELRAAEQMLRGRPEVAAVLLAAYAEAGGVSGDAEIRYDLTDANAAFVASGHLRELGKERLADGFLVVFQTAMSREHRANGLFGRSVAMARQALRTAEGWRELPGEHGALRLELASAQVAAGAVEDARATIASAPIPAVDFRRLPAEDQQRLVEAGLVRIAGGRLVASFGSE